MEKIDGINSQNSRQQTFSNFKNKQNSKDIYHDDNSPAGENLISSSVKHLNEYYFNFKTGGNNLALLGVDLITSTFADDPDALTSFILASEELKTIDKDSFNNLFELIGKLKEKGLNAQKFLKIFNSLDSLEFKRKFISSASRLISEDTDSEELEKLYNNFIIKINFVRFDKNLSKAQKNIYLESYFVSINTAKRLLDEKEFFSLS
ncbi:MAG: hypothetical protein PHC34_05675 [Candidatus Gastranaerophilales bacterium]|nr:hypothetical protein [Candidatus Gastranaerophilales bacterium]